MVTSGGMRPIVSGATPATIIEPGSPRETLRTGTLFMWWRGLPGSMMVAGVAPETMGLMPPEVTIRPAVDDDLSDSAAIYNHEIANSVATFDLDPPTLAYWQEKLRGAHPGDQQVVALDKDDDVVGYAYSWSYRPRPAYNSTRE